MMEGLVRIGIWVIQLLSKHRVLNNGIREGAANSGSHFQPVLLPLFVMHLQRAEISLALTSFQSEIPPPR